MTQDEKDAIKDEAAVAYVRCYGEPTSDAERFHVQKGIEAMAAVCFELVDAAAQGQEHPPATEPAGMPDAAERDDSDDAPTWLSLSDLPYRGGGTMSRRRKA